MPTELSLGRINMAVKACFASVSGFLPGSIWDDTEIGKEVMETLLEELSNALGLKIILASEPVVGVPWTVGALSALIYELRASFSPLAEQ